MTAVLGALFACAATGAGVLPAQADESFSVKRGALVGDASLQLAELPPAMTPHAVIGDPSTQDLYVIGLLGDVLGNAVSGTQLRPVGLRYGRRVGRGDARIVVGPADILPNVTTLQRGVTMRGGVAATMSGTILAVGLSTGSELYFLDARTLKPQTVSTFGTSVSLAVSGLSPALTKVGSVVGLGTRIYAADATAAVVAQVDLMSGMVTACPVDATVVGLSVSGGQVQVATTKGTGTLPATCSSAATASSGTPPAPSTGLDLKMPVRTYSLSERVLEMAFLNGATFNTLKSRRALVATIPGGVPVTLTVNNGTCQNTKFYVGDPAGTPVASNTVALSVSTPRLALYAEQTSPGEDCVATLSEMGGAGEAAIRIRGELESAGANVMLLDRSWSMERSLLGVGAAAASDQARVAAMRQAVASVLSAVTMIPAPGPWAFLPFTTDVQASLTTPASGFTSAPAISNPDNPSGMKVIGFGGATSDTLDPGGPGNLVQAMRSGLTRLASADQLAPSPGAERRLWVMTDGSSGTAGYGTFATLLPSMLRGNVSLHLLGVGALENDPLMQQMVSLSSRLSGEHLFGPALGQLGIAHTKIAFVENTLTTMVRSQLRGRPVGPISRGSLMMGQNMQNTFHLTRDKTTNLTDQWALHVLMFEDADATVQLQVYANGSTVGPRCLRVPNAIVCAAVGYDGDYKVIATGSRPGGAPTLAVLRSYLSSALNGGEVGFFPSFARSLNRSGDQVRVQLLLTERGMPLRGATVTAKVTGPNAAIGNIVAQGSAGQSDINNLITQSGDLSPGQAKGELLDPMSVPALRPLPPITLADDATNGDFEPQDGVYTGQFTAFVPGVYLIDIHADYSGQLGNAGTIEDRLVTQVVVGMDQTLTDGTERSVALATGGIRLRFTPQDAGKNLLGPGQAAALSFAQGSKAFAPVVSDYLDGSYRADVTGIDPTQPFDLVGPGTRVQIWSPNSGGGMAGGCSASAAGGSGMNGPGAAGLLALFGVTILLSRRLRTRRA